MIIIIIIIIVLVIIIEPNGNLANTCSLAGRYSQDKYLNLMNDFHYLLAMRRDSAALSRAAPSRAIV